MMRDWKYVMRVGLLLCLAWACGKQQLPLDEGRFRDLLIDLHRVDGTLAVNRGMRGSNDLKNYAYYNELFKKYGITRDEFDSCMYYYSAQTQLFSDMYDFIVDSLNKELTAADKVLNALKANDSVNYFPRFLLRDSLCPDSLLRRDTVLLDTIRLDSVVTVVIDSIVPGLYKFNTTMQFDSLSRNRLRYIVSYFLSEDGKDTLRVRNVSVAPDTIRRTYNWSQYADSLCARLVIRYMDVLPERVRPYNSGRNSRKVKKEKPVDLEKFGGRAWNNQLFRPYISRDAEERLKQNIRR